MKGVIIVTRNEIRKNMADYALRSGWCFHNFVKNKGKSEICGDRSIFFTGMAVAFGKVLGLSDNEIETVLNRAVEKYQGGSAL